MSQQTGAFLGLILPFVVMFGIFYVILIRPQQKEQKQRREMLRNLKKGDRVVTIGGIYGEITAIKDEVLTLRIADRVEVKMERWGVSKLVK